MTARVLVAGVGNVFLGDDGFGVEVVRRLALRPQADGVRVADFGVRGFDLTYALLDGYDAAILVDATRQQSPDGAAHPPGTLYVVAVDPASEETAIDNHGMTPARVLSLVRAMGAEPPPLQLVGCEVASLGDDDEPAVGLSAEVAAAIDPAVLLVEALCARLLAMEVPGA